MIITTIIVRTKITTSPRAVIMTKLMFATFIMTLVIIITKVISVLISGGWQQWS